MIKKRIKHFLWILGGGYKPKRFWNNWAKTFMNDSWQTTIHSQHWWLLQQVKQDNPKNILEIGIGFGRNIKFLIEQGISAEKITGVDISNEMLKKAKKYIDTKITLHIADARLLPFEKNSFDFVFLHGVLMHIPPDKIKESLDEIIRVSRKSVLLIEQNYGGNEYTFIHDYKKLLKRDDVKVIEFKSDKKLGLSLIKVVKNAKNK